MSQTVIGIFDNASKAQDAVEKLVKSGFDRSSIDISVNNTAAGSGSAGTSYGTASSDTTSTGFGTASSNTTGSGFGAASTDTLGTNFGTASSHSEEGESKIGKFFKSLFGGDDDDNAGYSNYAKAAEKGTIVTVHARSVEQAEDAADILDDYGAVNVDDNSAEYGSTGNSSNNTAGSLNVDQTNTTGSSVNIIEEQLNVGKKTVETGGVRLRSRIVERPVEESLRLREERVYVNRTPVNRPVTGDELNSFKEGSIELTETAEVPVVAKEAYVKEVVSVGKDVSERDETIRDTVRSTEVDVEDLGKGNISNTTRSTDYNDTNSTGTL